MNDERPRPQYGEYASPEDQRAHIRDPHANPHYQPPAAETQQPSQHDGAAPHTNAARPDASGTPHAPSHDVATPDARKRTSRTWDRSLTWVLIAMGLLNLALSVSSYLNMAPSLQAAYTQLGIGHFGATAIAGPAGIALTVVQAVIWVATAVLARLSLRRGRVSFWIPLVGAFVSYVALVAVLLVVVLNDPAFTTFVTTSASGS